MVLGSRIDQSVSVELLSLTWTAEYTEVPCLVSHFIILLLHHLILLLSCAATFDSVCATCYPLRKSWLDKNLYSNPVFLLFSCYASKWVEFCSLTGIFQLSISHYSYEAVLDFWFLLQSIILLLSQPLRKNPLSFFLLKYLVVHTKFNLL